MEIEKLLKTVKSEGKEKHNPVIESLDEVKKGEVLEVKIIIGKEMKHPNLPEHNINWVDLYFLPKDSIYPVHLARVEFKAHGEYDLYAESETKLKVKLNKSGKLIAISYCTIHGLWVNEKEIKVID